MTLKEQVRSELATHSQWFTIHELVTKLGIQPDRYETVSRALRKLREEGHVQARWSQQTARCREWSCANGNSGSTVPAVRPVKTTPATSLKGGTRSNAMCTPNNQPTFVKAVKDLTAEFMKSERTFSAYDVTTTLRERVNAGKVTINEAETGTVHVSGKNVAKVEHEAVKGIVHDLHNDGEMAGYVRQHNGKYWEYAPTDDDSVVTSASPATQPVAPTVAVISLGSPSDDDDSDDDYDGSSTL